MVGLFLGSQVTALGNGLFGLAYHFLGFLGLVKFKQMISAWRWVLMSSAIAGAVITPSTDPITMTLLAASIFALFLLGVLLVLIIEQIKEQIPPAAHPPSKLN